MDKHDMTIIEEIVKIFKNIGADIEKDDFIEFVENKESIKKEDSCLE